MTDTTLNTPWNLHFDRDGTEDFGIICDAEGQNIAASHLPSTRIGERTFETGTFWLPESEDDDPPVLLRQLQLMTAAPQLLTALIGLLDAIQELTIPFGRLWQFHEACRVARNAIDAANGRAS
jgi:hypothetical protein